MAAMFDALANSAATPGQGRENPRETPRQRWLARLLGRCVLIRKVSVCPSEQYTTRASNSL